MKTLGAALSAVLLIGVGCAEDKAQPDGFQTSERSSSTDKQTVEVILSSGVKSAIITQHTLYPYHFVTGSDSLNDLGRRDIAVLSVGFKAHGGDLNVPRGGTDAALYDARVKQVMLALKSSGVGADHVRISDGVNTSNLAQGRDAVTDLQLAHDQQKGELQTTYSDSTSSSSSSSSSSDSGSSSGGSSSSNSSTGAR